MGGLVDAVANWRADAWSEGSRRRLAPARCCHEWMVPDRGSFQKLLEIWVSVCKFFIFIRSVRGLPDSVFVFLRLCISPAECARGLDPVPGLLFTATATVGQLDPKPQGSLASPKDGGPLPLWS